MSDHGANSEIIHSDEDELGIEPVVTGDEENPSEASDEDEDSDDYTDEWVDVPDPRLTRGRSRDRTLSPDKSVSRSRRPVRPSARKSSSSPWSRTPHRRRRPSDLASRSRSQSTHQRYMEPSDPRRSAFRK
jgi:hypothetical protein